MKESIPPRRTYTKQYSDIAHLDVLCNYTIYDIYKTLSNTNLAYLEDGGRG